MKISRKWQKTFTALAAGLVVLAAGAGVAYAATEHSITQGNTDHSIYKVGRDIIITGKVNGDIFCAGQTINIDAEVNGDIICAGQTINVHGTVHGDVRAAGQTVTINAKVENNASLAGQDVTLPQNGAIGRDLGAAGQTVSILGVVGRDMEGAGNSIIINGQIGRNVKIAANQLEFRSVAKVGGNLEYTSPHLMLRPESAEIAGKVTYHKSAPKKSHSTAWAAAWRLYGMIAMSVLAVILVALFPQVFRRWNKTATSRTGWALLVGFAAMIFVPVSIVFAFATVVGVPLGFLMLLLWIAAILISFPLAMYYVGHSLFHHLHPVLVVLAGALIIGLLQQLPVLGGIVTFLAYLLGSGTLLLNLKQAYKAPDYSSK